MFLFEGDEAAFGFETGKKAGRSKDSQSGFVYRPRPLILLWTLSNLSVAQHGLTCGAEQGQLFSSKLLFLLTIFRASHIRAGREVTDRFLICYFPIFRICASSLLIFSVSILIYHMCGLSTFPAQTRFNGSPHTVTSALVSQRFR